MSRFCGKCHQPITTKPVQLLIETPEGTEHFDCFLKAQSIGKPGYFPPYDDLGNRRTIKNAVDCGWSAE